MAHRDRGDRYAWLHIHVHVYASTYVLSDLRFLDFPSGSGPHYQGRSVDLQVMSLTRAEHYKFWYGIVIEHLYSVLKGIYSEELRADLLRC